MYLYKSSHFYIHTLCIAIYLHVCHADTTLNQLQINYTHTQTIPKRTQARTSASLLVHEGGRPPPNAPACLV